MRTLATIDYVIIVSFVSFLLIKGVILSKKASSSVEDFFLGGRKMSWWLIGVSMAATNFSIDTPIAVTKFVAKEGISGVWFLWASAISAIFITFFFSRYWRRSGVLTDAEIIELRYSDKPASALRLFKGLYFGVIFNAFIMGWVFLSLSKVMAGVTDLNIDMVLWGSVIVVFLYSTASGFYGVVSTDFFQYFLALIGSIVLAVLSLKEVGGVGELINAFQTSDYLKPEALNFMPNFSEDGLMPFSVFLVYISVQWWAHKYSDGGGKHIQRMLAAKDENHAFKGSSLYTVLTYALQIWPWIITALCGLVIFKGIADPEMIYPRMMARVLPHGLLGLVVVCLIGAFMSTIDTHLNLGASYVVNDIYKRFIKKDADQKHYILVSRTVMLLLLILSVILSMNMKSVGGAWKFLLTFASGAGLTWVIRWFWWRANAWTELSGMIASGVIATILKFKFDYLVYTDKLLITVSLSTIIWLTVTFLTQPVSEKNLIEFINRVRPTGPGWKKIYQEQSISTVSNFSRSLKLCALGIVAFFLLNFGIGFMIFRNLFTGAGMIGTSIYLGVFIFKKRPMPS